MPTPRRAALAALTLSLAACTRIERSNGVAPLVDRRLVVEGVLGPAGGTLEPGPRQALAGIRLTIPPGALQREESIQVWARFGDPRLPSVVQSIEIEPRGLVLDTVATVTLPWSQSYSATAGEIWPDIDIEAWDFLHSPHRDLSLRLAVDRDVERRLLTTTIPRFCSIFAMHAELRSLVLGEPQLVDPTQPIATTRLGALLVRDDAGAEAIHVGQGTLDAFFAGGAEANLLVIPGADGEALRISGVDGLFPGPGQGGLSDEFANVVAFHYPSARGIRETGNWLYDSIRQRAQVGFACQALAHGGGGLVLRWALERAHADPQRPGFTANDRPLGELVERAIFLGTPNDGAPAVVNQFDALLAAIETPDARFVQGLADLIPGDSTVLDLLATDIRPATTRYFTLAGDVTGGSDGLVDVASALGDANKSLGAESKIVLNGPIYDHFALLMLGGRTGVLHQSRIWLGRDSANTRPLVSSLLTPVGGSTRTIDIEYRLVDADRDSCSVFMLYSFDGLRWFVASAAGFGGNIQTRGSLPAPGAAQVFRWDTLSDGIGLTGVARVVVRMVAADTGGIGITAESGWFMVYN
jgi:hypothetical protein